MYKILEPRKLGAIIAKIRKENDHSLEELAEKIEKWDGSKVTKWMVRDWEGGATEVRFYFLVQICNIYNISINLFL